MSGLLLSAQAFASVIAVGPDAFLPGSPVLTFDGFADGTEVNGLVYGGVRFSYEVGGVPLNGELGIYGPSLNIPANHFILPAVLTNPFTTVDKSGTLMLDLPSSTTLFGFGYVINTYLPFATRTTTVSLFNGVTPVGALTYTAVPDPGVPGGFAGIESTTPFDRVGVTFGGPAEFYGVDNITLLTAAAVPEPSTILSTVAGLSLLYVSAQPLRYKPNHPL
jgi:hypothetical protein